MATPSAIARTTTFPVPSSLQHLESEPHNLFPYPPDFQNRNEAARAASFNELVELIEDGNRKLVNFGVGILEDPTTDVINRSDRRQALYTLVRKSTSLAAKTRRRLVEGICECLSILSSLLHDEECVNEESAGQDSQLTMGLASRPASSSSRVMPQAFRDAYACHLYMLFSIMFFTESEAKGLKNFGNPKRGDKSKEATDAAASRDLCARTMLMAAQCMSNNRAKLWKRGVANEAVIFLPCRIAYQMLESATGVVASKAACADEALGMIAATIDTSDSVRSTIVAALMDLMHSYEHIAGLCVKLCNISTNRALEQLAMELIREIGRLDTSGMLGAADNGKASGIKYVAPFISELAQANPRLMMQHISHLLPHLESEPYNLRSSIVAASGHIVSFLAKETTAATATDHAAISSSDGSGHDHEHEELTEEENTTKQNLQPQQKTKEKLLGILMERCTDVSSYTRSTALKTWIGLMKEGVLPLQWLTSITTIAIDRLQDKTVLVRKQAIQLMTVLLENNPFLGDLDPEPYHMKLIELRVYVLHHLPENIKEAHDLAVQQDDADSTEDPNNIANDAHDRRQQLENAALAATMSEVSSWTDAELDDAKRELKARIDAFQFAEAALRLIMQIESASTALHNMLLSSNSSDVSEALRFFVKARHFKLPCSVRGMKQALSLMWSTEQSVKDEVLKAFNEVFLAEPGSQGSECLPDEKIAQNLLSLVYEASASELVSIEEGLGRLVEEEMIPSNVFNILWSAVARGGGHVKATAILVLGMAATKDKSIVDSKSRLKVLLDAAFEETIGRRQSWETIRAACIALQRIDRVQENGACAKYLIMERVIDQLSIVARGDWCNDADGDDGNCGNGAKAGNQTRGSNALGWFAASEQAISALFVISPAPEAACADIIVGMHALTFSSESHKVQPMRLARFCHVLGHIALRLLVYTEDISSSVRRANAKRSLKRQEEASQAKAAAASSTSNSKKFDGGDDDIEAELGMAAEVEAENERKVAEIAEQEIVGRGLVSAFGQLLVRIVSDETNWAKSTILMESAVLALCKFMCVSTAFCEKHMPVLFSCIEKAPKDNVTMRANTVVALGDLAFRFPNEVEPYTPRLYACLRDTSKKVRRHTLMVLTHLILNDMIKVKGQVCEIALCLRDDDPRIRDMSRLLFHELSKRSNNPVYNLLPDIISQLSTDSVAKEDFRMIMSFLLGYIKKDRQNEMLIEKLVLRFPKCVSITQSANVAYCMSQLKVNEKALKHLIDNFKLYKHFLHDAEVKKQFMSILGKIRKTGKAEWKQTLDEWSDKLNEEAELGAENERAQVKAANARGGRGLRELSSSSLNVNGLDSVAPGGSRLMRKGASTKLGSIGAIAEEDEEDDYEGESDETENGYDSEDESDDDDMEFNEPNKVNDYEMASRQLASMTLEE